MIKAILSFLGFSKIKLILFSLIGIGIVVFGLKIYFSIVENVENRIKIQQLEQSVKDKDRFIELQNNEIKLKEMILLQRDKIIEELEKKYEDITNDLGDDENELAPKSIQELMQRLNKK